MSAKYDDITKKLNKEYGSINGNTVFESLWS
jgi:hypothetical protein